MPSNLCSQSPKPLVNASARNVVVAERKKLVVRETNTDQNVMSHKSRVMFLTIRPQVLTHLYGDNLCNDTL
jgi:hypothetical protein